MKILILPFSPPTMTYGTLTRVLAVAHAAHSQGHTVAFCASGALGQRLQDIGGYDCFPTPRLTILGLPVCISHLVEKRASNVAFPAKPGKEVGNIWLVMHMMGMSRYAFLKRLVDAELRAVKEFEPDLLYTEMDAGAFLVSMISGVPLSMTYASVMEKGNGTWPYRKMLGTMNRVLARYDKEAMDNLNFHKGPNILKIIPSIKELEDVPHPDDSQFFAGPMLWPFQTPKDGDYTLDTQKRHVFVYLGTGSISMKKVETVLPKVFPAEGSSHTCLVVSANDNEERRVGNVVYRPFFNANEIIPKCDWVICHGGHNTIMQALSFGVPLIIFPGPIFERRFNAQKVAEAKVGIMGERTDFNPTWLREALDSREKYLETTRALQKSIQKYPGAQGVVQKMCSWLEE
jgi:UDP:flavonoid glycosyltransferase YjiC (YdhE family)